MQDNVDPTSPVNNEAYNNIGSHQPQQNPPPGDDTVEAAVQMRTNGRVSEGLASREPAGNLPEDEPVERQEHAGETPTQAMQSQQKPQAGQMDGKIDLGGGPVSVSEAPPNFAQQEKSAFSKDQKVKPRKSRLFCLLGCSLAVLIILIIGGVGAYAYYTDTQIPFISELVKQVELLIGGPKAQAEAVQQQLAQTIVSAMMPILSKDQSVASAFASSTVSEEYLQSLFDDYQAIDSFKFDVEIKTREDEQEVSASNIRGSIDGKDPQKQKMQILYVSKGSEFSSGSLTQKPFELEGELRIIGETTYVRLDKFDIDLFAVTIDNEYLGKWIDISYDEVDATGDIFIDSQTTESSISDEDIKKLTEFITHESVVKNVRLMDDEVIEGNSCTCIESTWNQQELQDVLQTATEIFGSGYEADEEGQVDLLQNISRITLELCSNKQTHMIHRVRLASEGVENNVPTYSEINIKVWDYLVPIDIEPPEDVIPLEEVFSFDVYLFDSWAEDIDTSTDPQIQSLQAQSLLASIQLEIEMYYLENGEYPDSLTLLDLTETEVAGEQVQYTKTDEGYRLWILLPDGEVLELTEEDSAFSF